MSFLYFNFLGCCRGAAVIGAGLINKVNLCQTQLVSGWVTIFRWVNNLHMERAN